MMISGASTAAWRSNHPISNRAKISDHPNLPSYLYLWIVSRRLPAEYAIALILSIRREGSAQSQFRQVSLSSRTWSQTGHDLTAMWSSRCSAHE
jgi:hypothetical protein